uniref:Abhydrolase_3 domain-containing protein n=1 Tax=Rhabditophanes sp. KR3021 TaxID=114890 RepID=A0AC35UFN9_9BILA
MNLKKYFWVSLPDGMEDRETVVGLQMFLKLFHALPSDLLDCVFGKLFYFKLLRFWTSLQWLCNYDKPKDIEIRQVVVGGVPCTLYLPLGQLRQSDTCIIFSHGGGYALLHPYNYELMSVNHVRKIGCAILSIDYTLAPTKIYPGQLNEVMAVILDFHEDKALEWGLSPLDITLFGDSAGANLVTVACNKLNKQGKGHLIKNQILIYPTTSGTDFLSPSYLKFYEQYSDHVLVTPEMKATMYLLYFGLEITNERVEKMLYNEHVPEELRKLEDLCHDKIPEELWSDIKIKRIARPVDNELVEVFKPFLYDPEIFPIMEKDEILRKCPRTWIVTADFDMVRDEGIFYHKKLQKLGVNSQWTHYKGTSHGFLSLPSVSAVAFADHLETFIKNQ